MDRDFAAQEFTRLAEALHLAPNPTQTAEQVVAYAQVQLDAHYAGITLIRRGGRLETLAPSDPVVVEVDDLQYKMQEGGCFDSSWEGGTLLCQDLAADARWPNWGPRAAALGLRALIAAELTHAEGRRLGAVNMFWTETKVFTSDDIAYSQLFARHAALALTASLQVAGLNVALDTRKLIGQAQGILMERFDLDAERAFEVLRRYSQNTNVKLREVAAELVQTRALPMGSDEQAR